MSTSEGAIESGAQTAEQLRIEPHAAKDHLHDGERSAGLSAGRLDSPEEATEHSPLLHRRRGARTPGRSDEDDEQDPDDGNKNAWPGQADFDGLPWYQKPTIWWLILPFFFFTMAFGATLVPKVNLINDLICRDYYGFEAVSAARDEGNDICDSAKIEKITTAFTLATNLVSGIPAAIVSPKLGALSDRYGRTRIQGLCAFGLVIAEAIILLAGLFPVTVNYRWILLGYLFDGLCGSFISGMALANSYATDCTPPSQRNSAFAFFHGCLFSGIAIGPLLGAFVMKATGSILSVFWISLIAHMLFGVFVIFVVPESLSKRRQIAAREKHAIAQQESSLSQSLRGNLAWFKEFFTPLKLFWPTEAGSSRSLRINLVIIAAIDTVSFGIAMGVLNIYSLYLRHVFHWDTATQSEYVAVVNFVRIFCLFLILPAVSRLFRGARSSSADKPAPQKGADLLDLWIIRVGVLCDVLGFIGFALAKTGPPFFLAGCVSAIGDIAAPTLQAALTKHVPHDRTGQLLGASGQLHGLARIVAPVIVNGIFYKTLDSFPQAVYVTLAAAFGVALLLSILVRPHLYLNAEERPESRQAASDNGRE